MTSHQHARSRRCQTAQTACAALGFTYLWLLFILAVGSATLAALAERNSTAVLRDRETELLFRGQAIAIAIASYWQATPGKNKALPTSLQDLVDDRRGDTARHHLRRVYPDPYTGLDDWVLLKDEAAGIVGVHSRANARAFKTASLPPNRRGPNSRVSDHIFTFMSGTSSDSNTAPLADLTEPQRVAPE